MSDVRASKGKLRSKVSTVVGKRGGADVSACISHGGLRIYRAQLAQNLHFSLRFCPAAAVFSVTGLHTTDDGVPSLRSDIILYYNIALYILQ